MEKLKTLSTTPTTPRNSTQAGYGYRWQKFRAGLLAARKMVCASANVSPCEDCAAEGNRYEVHKHPLEVHHVKRVRDAPHLQYEPSNCVLLCKRHHSLRTMAGE